MFAQKEGEVAVGVKAHRIFGTQAVDLQQFAHRPKKDVLVRSYNHALQVGREFQTAHHSRVSELQIFGAFGRIDIVDRYVFVVATLHDLVGTNEQLGRCFAVPLNEFDRSPMIEGHLFLDEVLACLLCNSIDLYYFVDRACGEVVGVVRIELNRHDSFLNFLKRFK